MKFTIDTRDIERIRQGLAGFSSRRLNAALATGLTHTALAVKAAEQAEMRDVFDRPTRYTLGAIGMTPATAEKLQATVFVKDDASGGRPPSQWLRWQIRGGLRTQTGFEKALVRGRAMDGGDRAVPGKYARLDAFGNMSPGQMQQILSQLRIERAEAGSSRALPRLGRNEQKLLRQTGGKAAKARSNLAKSYVKDALAKRKTIVAAYRRAGGQFIALPYGRGELRPGIYLVDRLNSRDVLPVVIFVSRAQYEAGRFDFQYVAGLVIKRELQGQVNRALRDQIVRLSAARGA